MLWTVVGVLVLVAAALVTAARAAPVEVEAAAPAGVGRERRRIRPSSSGRRRGRAARRSRGGASLASAPGCCASAGEGAAARVRRCVHGGAARAAEPPLRPARARLRRGRLRPPRAEHRGRRGPDRVAASGRGGTSVSRRGGSCSRSWRFSSGSTSRSVSSARSPAERPEAGAPRRTRRRRRRRRLRRPAGHAGHRVEQVRSLPHRSAPERGDGVPARSAGGRDAGRSGAAGVRPRGGRLVVSGLPPEGRPRSARRVGPRRLALQRNRDRDEARCGRGSHHPARRRLSAAERLPRPGDNAASGSRSPGRPAGRSSSSRATTATARQRALALPSRWKVLLAGLVLAALVYLVARGRRLGPPEEESREPPPPRRAYVDSLAARHRPEQAPRRRGRAPCVAEAAARLRRAVGLAADADDDALPGRCPARRPARTRDRCDAGAARPTPTCSPSGARSPRANQERISADGGPAR